MEAQEIVGRCSQAAEELAAREHPQEAVQLIEDLCAGITLLRDEFFSRVHRDVESRLGIDSLITPISEEKTERTAKLEIEIYQVVVAAAAAESRKLVADGHWFRGWLARLRLGDFPPESRAARRLSYYAAKSSNEQRLAFSNVLAQALPESERAPLILLKLFPLAVGVVTALAFGKLADAEDFRGVQAEILTSIADCRECHGHVLDVGRQCRSCGNPLWTYDWLIRADE